MAMTWQGQGGTGGTGSPGGDDEATRADVPVSPEPQPANQVAPSAPPTAPSAQPPAAPSAQPPAAVPAAAATSPWAPPDSGSGNWGVAPPGGKYAVPGALGLVYAGAIPRAAAWLVDSFLLGIIVSIISIPFAATAAIGFDPTNGTVDSWTQLTVRSGIAAVIAIVVEAVYFIGFWMSSGRATLGMRLFNLQVGNFADGTKLRTEQAAKRWFAYGSWAGLAGLVPIAGAFVGLLQLAWTLVLLVTTASSPTKQGLHDRFAETAVVRPASAGNGLAITCLVVFVALPLLFLFLLVPLIFLGGQVSDILSAVGESI
jgi:uncharacterized RDD family membrane protein YckC